MFLFLLSLQWIGIFVFITEILYILEQKNSKLQTILLVLCFAGLINTVGYLFEMTSTTPEMALMAVKFIYVGKPFIVLSMFFLVAEFCHINIKMWLKYLLVLIHVTIPVAVSGTEIHKLFYSDIGYTQEGIFPHLVLGHGPVYWVYIVQTFLYGITMGVMLKRFHKRSKLKSQRTQIYLMYTMVSVSLLGLILFMTGVTQGYDATAISYLVGTILLSISLYKYNLLDVVSVAKDIAIDQINDGMIVADTENRILYCNQVAKNICPVIEGNNQAAIDELLEKLWKKAKKGSNLHQDKAVFSVSRKEITNNDEVAGILYVLIDVTDSYNYTLRLEEDVRKKTEHLRSMHRSVTLGLANVIESRDTDTGGHVKRTSDVVKIFVEELKKCERLEDYSDSFFEDVINAAPMHDLGKIGVPDHILNKPGKYTPEEYEAMKTHSKIGADIIAKILENSSDMRFRQVAMNIAHFHHEKWDGSGYPVGLKGAQIPVEARIMALADVFDALVSARCYKKQMSYDEAFKIIKESLGSHFDAELGEHFLECRSKLEEYYNSVQ